MSEGHCFFMGFMLAAIISVILGIILLVRPHTEISQEILRNIQQSTNIVEALKKENLVIRKVWSGSEADTVEIVVEYDFLYKNSIKK
jgi:hypothetical protein